MDSRLLFLFDMDDVLYDYDWRARMSGLTELTGVPFDELRRRWWHDEGEWAAEAGRFPDADAYLSAFVAAGRALNEPAWTARAKGLARFLLDHSREGGRLLRFPKGSGPAIPAFLDDHVHLADGLLDLADATGEAEWADAARSLADAVLKGFSDPAGGFSVTDRGWPGASTASLSRAPSPVTEYRARWLSGGASSTRTRISSSVKLVECDNRAFGPRIPSSLA